LILQTFDAFDHIRDQVQEAGSALRRAFLISFNPVARLTLGQRENRLDFRKIMDSGTSVILNLGNINDSETRRLIGALLLVQIEQAALSRTNLAPAERRPFTVFIDEWPSFAAQDETIGTILSQTRKFNLRLYLAAQSTAQISAARLAGALENCRLNIVFGLGRDSAVRQSQQIASVDPMVLKEEARTETQHGQYVSIPEQFESWTQDIMQLKPRLAYVKLDTSRSVKVRTPYIPNRATDPAALREVLDTYKSIYQLSLADAEHGAAMASANHLKEAPKPFALFDPRVTAT